MVYLAEKNGIGAVAEHLFKWPHVFFWFSDCVFPEHLTFLDGKYLLHNAMYCIHKNFALQYMELCEALYNKQKKYLFGFDMSSFNILFYQQIKKSMSFIYHEPSCLVQAHAEGLKIGSLLDIQRINLNHPAGLIALSGPLKTWGYRLLERPNEIYTQNCADIEQNYCEERRCLVSQICNLRSWSILYREYFHK